MIRQILAGNKQAFAELERKYRRLIAGYIRRMIRDEDDAEDIIQETFIKAYNALESFKPGYSFSAWINRIASNTCIDFLRKKRFNVVSLSQSINPAGEDDNEFDVRDPDLLPDELIMSEEKSRIVRKAIESLPENYRKVIKLRHEDELDYQQIADMLNLPLGTVKAHLFRARKILGLALKKQMSHLSD